MSGLCGWLGASRSDKPAEAILSAMAAALGPAAGSREARAAAGLWVDGDSSRLFFDERHLVAVFGDPWWPAPDLAERARERGHAETALEAFRRSGLDFLAQIRGPFSLALLDLEAGEAMVAADRFGVHRIYYAATGERLVFGSTADAVRAHPDVSATLDPQGIYNYFSYFMVPAPGAIYKEQQKLLPGQVLHYREGTARQSFYWTLDYSPEPLRASEQQLAETLHELLTRSVARAVDDAEGHRIGAFLSGGLDSSTVVGLLRKVTGAGPRTFTVGFDAEPYDEAHYARIAAERFGASSHEHYLTLEESVDAVPRIAAFYDEPFGNSSAVPAYYCARSAAERDIDILFAGDGGDELFAGNARYATETARERYFRLLQVVPTALIGPGTALLGRGRAARRARNFLALMTTPLPDRMLAYEHVAPDEARAMFTSAFLSKVDLDGPMALARETYFRTSSPAPLHRMMHLDLRLATADNDLRKVSTMCRMAGVRVRFPFLDEDLATFAAKIPAEILLAGGELRAFYKSAMRGFLPQEIIEKKKHGFGMPYDLWLESETRLREIAAEAARSFRERDICRSSYVDALLTRSAEGDGKAASRLWDLMILELWLQAHGVST